MTEAKRGLRVAQVFDGAPAEDAGIGAGDLIVAVDGKPLAGVSATPPRPGSRARPGPRSS